MKILSVDPGYDRVGIAVIERKTGEKEKLLYSDCFTTDKNRGLNERIFSVGQEIDRVIKQFSPNGLVLEKLYFSNNKITAMGVSEARGAIIYEAHRNSLPVAEYTPVEIKVAVASYGKATKEEVYKMVEKLIDLPTKKRLDDEVDAIAIGLTAFAHKAFL